MTRPTIDELKAKLAREKGKDTKAEIGINKPLPERIAARNKSLTWKQWQEQSEIIEITTNEHYRHGSGLTLEVFQHPTDPNYYCIADSWQEKAHEIHIILKQHTNG